MALISTRGAWPELAIIRTRRVRTLQLIQGTKNALALLLQLSLRDFFTARQQVSIVGVCRTRSTENPGVFNQYAGQRVSISFPGINLEIPGGLAGLHNQQVGPGPV